MPSRAEITQVVFDEFDTLWGYTPSDSETASIKYEDEELVAAFHSNVMDALGLDFGMQDAPADIREFIRWLEGEVAAGG